MLRSLSCHTCRPSLARQPAVVQQPFPWMEALPVPGMPLTLRRLQIDGEWDRAY